MYIHSHKTTSLSQVWSKKDGSGRTSTLSVVEAVSEPRQLEATTEITPESVDSAWRMLRVCCTSPSAPTSSSMLIWLRNSRFNFTNKGNLQKHHIFSRTQARRQAWTATYLDSRCGDQLAAVAVPGEGRPGCPVNGDAEPGSRALLHVQRL